MSFLNTTLSYLIPSVTVYNSASEGGPFNRQSLRITLEGGGWFMLLFIHILRGVVSNRLLL
jgi:hypothetical protein